MFCNATGPGDHCTARGPANGRSRDVRHEAIDPYAGDEGAWARAVCCGADLKRKRCSRRPRSRRALCPVSAASPSHSNRTHNRNPLTLPDSRGAPRRRRPRHQDRGVCRGAARHAQRRERERGWAAHTWAPWSSSSSSSSSENRHPFVLLTHTTHPPAPLPQTNPHISSPHLSPPHPPQLDLPKPLGLKFARGNDGGAYVVANDANLGNTDPRVEPGDKIVEISASFGNEVWKGECVSA